MKTIKLFFQHYLSLSFLLLEWYHAMTMMNSKTGDRSYYVGVNRGQAPFTG